MGKTDILITKEIVQKNVEESLVYGKKHGVDRNIFFAYSNMLRELIPVYPRDKIFEQWKMYQVQLETANELRSIPLCFSEENNIMGFEKILEEIDRGGFIFTYHYGNYRVALGSILKAFQKYKVNKKINIIVDQDSLEHEPQNLKDMKESIQYICAEDISIAREISRKIDQGEWIFIFLDGNTGYGDDRKPIYLDFLSSNIKLRSGIFRLMLLKNRPVFPMLETGGMEQTMFWIMDNVNENPKKPYTELAGSCYAPFLKVLRENPENWRFWYRHHRQVKKWKKINGSGQMEISDYRLHAGEQTYGINLYDGSIYRL